MKQWIFGLSALLALWACQGNGEPVISGTIEGAGGLTVYFEEMDGQGMRLIDSAKVEEDGRFAMYKKAGAMTYYRLRLGPEKPNFGYAPPDNVVILLTDSTEKISFTSQKDSFSLQYEVQGSVESALFKDLSDLADSSQKALQALGQQLQQAPMEQRDAISARFAELQQQLRERYRGWIQQHEGKFVTLQAMSMIDPELNFDVLQAQAQILQQKFPTNVFVGRLVAKVNELGQQLRVGQKAPDFTIETPDGKPVSLSDFLGKGKFVLIDFWASWCRPCREENPNLVATYNRFKDKVTFFGVSLDDNAARWKEAIQQDGLTWPQGSDLASWNAAPARLYQVNSIPANVIVNADGEIVGKNARGPALDQLLEQLTQP
jgi:peroxiredoxin